MVLILCFSARFRKQKTTQRKIFLSTDPFTIKLFRPFILLQTNFDNLAAKEKLEIVSGAVPRYHPPLAELRGKPPPFRIFAGGLPYHPPSPKLLRVGRRRNAPCPIVSFALLLGFGLIQEYCTLLDF